MNSYEILRIFSEIELVATSEDTIFIFCVCKLSAKSPAQKVYNEVYLSEITARTLTFRDRTADSFIAIVVHFLHATSSGLSVTVAFFSASIPYALLLFGVIY